MPAVVSPNGPNCDHVDIIDGTTGQKLGTVTRQEYGELAGIDMSSWTPQHATNKATLEAALVGFLDGAATAIANMQAVAAVNTAIQGTAQVSITSIAQAQTVARAEQARVKSLSAQVAQIAVTSEAHIRKTVALARYVSGQLGSLNNT